MYTIVHEVIFLKQHRNSALKLFGERIFFSVLALALTGVFMPIIGTFSDVNLDTGVGSYTGIGPVIFSIMISSLYLGIGYDIVWKIGTHDRQSYATEKSYPLKGLVIGLLAEIPNFILLLFLVIFPDTNSLFALYRSLFNGTYMGFLPADRITIGYGLILLIMPTIAMLAYLVGYKKKPSDTKTSLSQKIMYKQKKK